MEFTAKDVMALRERSGAGMMDCKRHSKSVTAILKRLSTICARRALLHPQRRLPALRQKVLLTASFVKNAASASSSKSTAKPTLLQRPTISKTLLLPLQSMLQRRIPLPLKI